MLRTEGLRLAYPGRTLVEGLSIGFQPGDVWAVLGRNGSGKSTLLHALAALRYPQAGRVMLGDDAVASVPRRALARQVGVLLQDESREFWGSVRDYVLLGRYPHTRSPFGWSAEDERIAEDEIEAMHLQGLADRPFATLSGGERQRARAAALFTQRPAVYLLDEPLQHLDLRHQLATLRLLRAATREAGAAAALVLHDLAFAGRCDRILMLYGDGRHATGTAAELLQEERLEELYGCRVRAFGDGADAHFIPVI